MAKAIRIDADIFDNEKFLFIESLENRDEIIVLYFKMLIKAYKNGNGGTIKFDWTDLTDEVLETIFRTSNIKEKIKVLEDLHMIEREKKAIKVFNINTKVFQGRDRNCENYRLWRTSVFERDNYKCQGCGTSKDLQAHHIEHWKDCVDKRFDVDNGITLCKKCHLKAHGGKWNG